MSDEKIKAALSAAMNKLPVPEVKPGKQSSELYVVVGTVLAGVLNKKLGLDISGDVIGYLIGLAASYVLSRTLLKSKASK